MTTFVDIFCLYIYLSFFLLAACFGRGCVYLDERCHNDLIQSSPYDSCTGKLDQTLSLTANFLVFLYDFLFFCNFCSGQTLHFVNCYFNTGNVFYCSILVIYEQNSQWGSRYSRVDYHS